MGSWLAFCLIISTTYKGSLISHLSVRSKTTPLETLEELVALEGTWNWGIEKTLYKGAVVDYYVQNTGAVVRKFVENFEVREKKGDRGRCS